MDDLIERLRRAKLRHESGYMKDVGFLLAEAADALSQQRAVAEGYVLVSTRQLGRWKKAAGEVADYMSRAKVSRHIYAQSELLAAEIHFELAAAPSPEQEK